MRPEPASSLQNKGLLSTLQLPLFSPAEPPGLPSSSPYTAGTSTAQHRRRLCCRRCTARVRETRAALLGRDLMLPALCQPCTMHIPVSEEEVKGAVAEGNNLVSPETTLPCVYRSPPNLSGGPAHGDSKTAGNRAPALERIHGLDLCSYASPYKDLYTGGHILGPSVSRNHNPNQARQSTRQSGQLLLTLAL